MTKVKNNNIIKRSLARLIAVQTLYQYDFYKAEKDINILMNELLDNYILDESSEDKASYRNKIDVKFLEKLIEQIIPHLSEIDQEISNNLKDNRQIEDLSDLMLAILRFGIFELKYNKNINSKIIINEYVDIAASFYDIKQVSFVNAILDKIVNV